MLSIIVALYNEKNNIEKCVESVLAQTLNEFELLLVDDGSTDESGDICDSYAKKDAKIKTIHKENGGLISARMCGIRNAKGDYITFLDCDDWVDDTFYEELYKPILQDNSIDISVSSILDDMKLGGIKNRFKPGEEGIVEKKTAIKYMYEANFYDWSGCGKIYRKELVLDFINDWWFTEPLGEDAEWNWKVFHKANQIYYIPTQGYHYFENINSMTHTKIDMKNLVLLDRFERMIESTSDDEQELRDVLWKVLAQKSTERITRMICFETNNEQEIQKCRGFIKEIPESAKTLLPERIKDKIELYISDWNTVLKKKIDNDNAIEQSYKKLIEKGAKSIYVYGAGAIGDYVGFFLNNFNLNFMGYLISSNSDSRYKLNDKAIISIDAILDKDKNNIGILLALNATNKAQVEETLLERNFSNYVSVGEYTYY